MGVCGAGVREGGEREVNGMYLQIYEEKQAEKQEGDGDAEKISVDHKVKHLEGNPFRGNYVFPYDEYWAPTPAATVTPYSE